MTLENLIEYLSRTTKSDGWSVSVGVEQDYTSIELFHNNIKVTEVCETSSDDADAYYLALNKAMDWFRQKMNDVVHFDSIVNTVTKKFKDRSEIGINKYGTTMDRNDLSTEEWLVHLQEELMDATLYIEKLMHEFRDRTSS